MSHRIESKHEVTVLKGINELMVKFYGPKGSEYDVNESLNFVDNDNYYAWVTCTL